MSDLALQAVGLAAVFFHAVPAGISTDIAAGMLEMAGASRVFPENLLAAIAQHTSLCLKCVPPLTDRFNL